MTNYPQSRVSNHPQSLKMIMMKMLPIQWIYLTAIAIRHMTQQKKENKRPRRKVVRHEIKTVVMPLRPPCADASCTDTKTVMVYYARKNCKK